jgi:cellular nucleic acid-binding protein
MDTVYVLECSNNKYYVGKTRRNVNTRFEEHRNGTGSEWTRLYRPIRIVESERSNNSHLELNKTLDYMSRYGIDDVRGSCYSNVNLSETEKQNIRQLLSSRNDTCYNCGRTGHFANNCNYSNENANNNNSHGCFKCGSTDHFAYDCNNYFDESDSSCDENDDNKFYRCFRCGSPSHFANNCYKESDSSNDEDNSYYDDNERLSYVVCYRCGHTGHYANRCNN